MIPALRISVYIMAVSHFMKSVGRAYEFTPGVVIQE